jgi:hypothetical protein
MIVLVLTGAFAPWGVGGTRAATGPGTLLGWGGNEWGQLGTTNESCGGDQCSRAPIPLSAALSRWRGACVTARSQGRRHRVGLGRERSGATGRWHDHRAGDADQVKGSWAW